MQRIDPHGQDRNTVRGTGIKNTGTKSTGTADISTIPAGQTGCVNTAVYGIQEACERDLEELLKIAAASGLQASRDDLRYSLESDSRKLTVFRIDGHPAGYIELSLAGNEAELIDIAVTPECRGKGTGRKLVEDAQAFLCSLSARAEAGAGEAAVFLEVREDNHNARRLYSAAGFTETGRRKNYYDDGTDALIMVWRQSL